MCTKAITSVLSSGYSNINILLVDDASHDLIPQKLADSLCSLPVTYIRHDTNKGLSSSRNSALSRSTGKYFSFCDDDDLWSPGLSARLILAIENSPDEVGMAIALPQKYKDFFYQTFTSFPRLSELMKAGLTPPVSSQIYVTQLLHQIGGYRSEISSGVDHDLWISLSRIDPKVAIAWGEPAVVGSSPNRPRLTTLEPQRRAGIERSLRIWEQDISDTFGVDFYHHFVYSYYFYLDYSFFVKSIRKRAFRESLMRLLTSPRLFFELMKRLLLRSTGKSTCFLFPQYKSVDLAIH